MGGLSIATGYYGSQVQCPFWSFQNGLLTVSQLTHSYQHNKLVQRKLLMTLWQQPYILPLKYV